MKWTVTACWFSQKSWHMTEWGSYHSVLLQWFIADTISTETGTNGSGTVNFLLWASTLYIISSLSIGCGSLSSPMREHQNFAQFYCISVTNFSTVSECILLEIIWIKRTFSSHSYGCFYVCMQCTSKNRQLIFYRRYLPFVRCRSRGPRHERKQSMCLSARWKSDTHCTQQYVVSLDRKLNADPSGVNAMVVYKHLWSLERNFKPQNTLNCLKYPPSKWSWIRTLSNEVWG